MINKVIAQKFKLLAALLEIHNQDVFKVRSYQKGARIIEKHPQEISTMTPEAIFAVPGIGKAIGNKTIELLEKGSFEVLDEWLAKTPSGIVEMIQIKGLGPKKIASIWQDLGIESLGELLYACNENRLMLYKGFGEKTQASIQESIIFYMDHQGQFLYAQVEPEAHKLTGLLKEAFPAARFSLTGDFNRHELVIDRLVWITDLDLAALETLAQQLLWNPAGDLDAGAKAQTQRSWVLPTGLRLTFIRPETKDYLETLFELNCDANFYQAFRDSYPKLNDLPIPDNSGLTEDSCADKVFFTQHQVAYIPPYLRNEIKWLDLAVKDELPTIITPADVKGVIHAHSRYSDGANTLAEMAKGAQDLGYEYLVITDHSQTAVYANGLKPSVIMQQHEEIDALNQQLAPFKIFKSIESDILRNGELDYAPNILAGFDLVIASVHAGLQMTQADATQRLLNAIENKYTSVLGHMTGRLLLSRKGFPLDLERILDACQEHQVVIELNANPRRLDMDWHHIQKALDRNLLISINPDAHSIQGIKDIRYGVLAAQKAGVMARQNLSSFSLQQMEDFVAGAKHKRN